MALSVRVHRALAEIPEKEWNALTGQAPTPVFDWAWLHLLETAGGLDARHGWTPLHLTLWRGSDLVAGAPLYGRADSWGDFVYDFSFADAAARVGANWYPKLVGMCPATPSVGWRVFVRPGEDQAELEAQWFAAADALAQSVGAASLQANFTDPAWSDGLEGTWRRWSHQNFLWKNQDYTDFDGYLGAFDKNQRRNIKRERKSLAEQGLSQRIVSGHDIPEAWFGLMGRLYDSTNDQFGPWAAKFLEPSFFGALGSIRHLLSFSATFLGDDPVPMALGFLLGKNGRLVGRYWGEREHFSDQYFNVCYYGPIEEAIRLGYRDFDPGAGSELKVRRGFQSERNVSLHRFYDAAADKLFATYLGRMNRQEEARIAALNEAVPFKQTSE
jgi:uncharacterized protein